MTCVALQIQSPSWLLSIAFAWIRFGSKTTCGNIAETHPQLMQLIVQTFHTIQSIPVIFPERKVVFMARNLKSKWQLIDWDNNPFVASDSDAIACDGSFIYVMNASGLFKFGVGNNKIRQGKLYAQNTQYVSRPCADKYWLCCIGEHLYCRTSLMDPSCVDRICKHTLELNMKLYVEEPIGIHHLENENLDKQSRIGGQSSPMISDGKHLIFIHSFDRGRVSTKSCQSKRKFHEPNNDPLATQVDTTIPLKGM